jgi:hypothetical protein
MKKILLFGGLSLVLLTAAAYYFVPRYTSYHLPVLFVDTENDQQQLAAAQLQKLRQLKPEILAYNSKHGLSQQVCFIADLREASGQFRFLVYDLQQDSIVKRGLVAHGSCNKLFLDQAEYSNTPDCGCSSKGKYKVGYLYKGRFGDAFKLYGLDSSNSNAFKRFIVLHAHECVPDSATHPQPICNSLGCPTVSPNMLTYLKKQIKANKKPILLWVID